MAPFLFLRQQAASDVPQIPTQMDDILDKAIVDSTTPPIECIIAANSRLNKDKSQQQKTMEQLLAVLQACIPLVAGMQAWRY